MNIFTTQYHNKIGISYLYWDIQDVLPKDILKIWKLFSVKNTFHDVIQNFPCRITSNKISKIKYMLRYRENTLLEKIAFWLNKIQNSDRVDFKRIFYDDTERLTCHLVCVTVAYKSLTSRFPEYIKVPCELISYHKSFKKAVKNYVEADQMSKCFCGYAYGGCGCSHTCGCIYIPNNVEIHNHTAALYKNIPFCIYWKQIPHRIYVVEKILNAVNFFPSEINELICSFL
jgi:hypothetical protein